MSSVARYSAPGTRPFVPLVLFSLLCLIPLPTLSAQETPEALRQKIEKLYPCTKTTASLDDIVTAGAVLILEKDGLVMSQVGGTQPAQDKYEHGKVSATGLTKAATLCPFGMCDKAKMGKFRTFVAGEKFWITKVDVHDTDVTLSFFTDAISDIRYISFLKFPFTKSSAIPSDQILASIAEVIKVQPSDNAPAEPVKSPTPAEPPPPPPPPAMAPIPPPPPPPDAAPAQPPSVKIGQTMAVVVANFGKPTKILDKGATQIYVYPDMKVTFGKTGKVVDIE